MDTFVKITKFIINLITSIIILFGIAFIILFAVGIQPFVVETGSMEPAIETKSVCFINKKIPYEDVKVGDIIAFRISDDACATHRVHEISEQGIITKGDANANIDNVITTKETYMGKNVVSIPKVGNFIKVLQSTRGKIIMGTIVIVLFVAGIMLGTPSEKSKKDNEEVKKE